MAEKSKKANCNFTHLLLRCSAFSSRSNFAQQLIAETENVLGREVEGLGELQEQNAINELINEMGFNETGNLPQGFSNGFQGAFQEAGEAGEKLIETTRGNFTLSQLRAESKTYVLNHLLLA